MALRRRNHSKIFQPYERECRFFQEYVTEKYTISHAIRKNIQNIPLKYRSM